MDDGRFDQWTRSLAAGTSRRSVLRGIVGAAAGVVGIAGVRSAAALSQQDGSGEQGDLGDPCSEVLTCGSGLVCTDGVCAAADGSGEQGDEGDPCSEVLTCGPNLLCDDGVCTAVTLPSTGTGDSAPASGATWLAPAALAGGAAFLLRRQRDGSTSQEATD
jgi:hypothetical protein